MRDDNVYQIYENIKVIKKQSFENLNKLSLKKSQISVLMVIYFKHLKQEKVNLKEISKELDLKNSTISPIVFELEELGYISRVSDSNDRRISYFDLTDYGLVQINKIKDSIYLSVDEMMKVLSDDEVEQLLYLTNKIRRAGNNE